MRAEGLTVEVCWVLAHNGTYGNEVADRAGKEATGWGQRGPPGPRVQQPPILRSLTATLMMWSHRVVNGRWQAQWHRETRGRATFLAHTRTNTESTTATQALRQEVGSRIHLASHREDRDE